jgi:hypothetical protein
MNTFGVQPVAEPLTNDGRCSAAVTADDMHLVLEGLASKVVDPALRQSVADAYRLKYDWNARPVAGQHRTRRACGLA